MSESENTFGEEPFVEKYGEDLGKALFHIQNRWCRLFVEFIYYANLFGKDRERVELLNWAAPVFFRVVQDQLFDTILLRISRLTDPPKSGSNTNLSIRQFPRLVDDDVKDDVRELIALALESAQFARERRNKVISHNDLELATSSGAAKPSGSIIQMRAAIRSIHEPIRLIRKRYEDVDTLPRVITNRVEFYLLKTLYHARLKEDEIREDRKAHFMKGDFSDFYPDWLFNQSEEDSWKFSNSKT
jgi:hypothetical protein